MLRYFSYNLITALPILLLVFSRWGGGGITYYILGTGMLGTEGPYFGELALVKGSLSLCPNDAVYQVQNVIF